MKRISAKATYRLWAFFGLFILQVAPLLAQLRPQIIPCPTKSTVPIKDVFEWGVDDVHIEAESVYLTQAHLLSDQIALHRFYIPKVQELKGKPTAKRIVLKHLNTRGRHIQGSYSLHIDKNNIWIEAQDLEGMVHGVYSLIQMVPVATSGTMVKPFSLAAWVIEDAPQFPHRGLLLDCGRHFMSVGKIKETLDVMAMYKLNVLHWHLTEDQGWRIEIKKYPKLTEIGGYRMVNGVKYGGYYTQEQIKDIVGYAARLGISVIPEIELPGHSVAAIAAYPHLSCTGKPIPVENEWGVFKDIYCAGNDQTLQFLKDVMDEVITLFPSQYIHIGGDEAPKVRWEHCDKCQKRIQDQHLKNEAELQTWLIEEIAKYLKARGKDIIGWDEILEGGIPGDALIQSWRGMQGGFDAAMAGHGVVMSPTSHCYLDYGLDGIDTKKVYEFDPIPAELPVDKHGFILGAECNMWTERAPEEIVTSKIFPRLIALAEVLWTYPETRDYKEFEGRLKRQYPLLDRRNIHYGFESTPVQFRTEIVDHQLQVEVVPQSDQIQLSYYLQYIGDESVEENITPLAIKGPVAIHGMKRMVVQMQQKGANEVKEESKLYATHWALGRPLKLNYKPSNAYLGGGDNGLVNGTLGSDNFRDGHWQAVQGVDMEMIVDLESIQSFSVLSTRWFHYANAWIFRPESVEYYVSVDGNNWEKVKRDELSKRTPANQSGEFVVSSQARAEESSPYGFYTGRYIKVKAQSIGKCPDWHDAPGEPSWLFCDELIVR